ncbi:hypothetical protein BRAS3843_2470030 [Bradyrhizobium sp. STM 3843]|nr:hypothetical protein BRAS3843_2470030 [Bradyrhizobium sp. STM 3843]
MSKADLALMLASNFKLAGDLKNVILAVFRLLAFLHRQGQKRPMGPGLHTFDHASRADVLSAVGRVRNGGFL